MRRIPIITLSLLLLCLSACGGDSSSDGLTIGTPGGGSGNTNETEGDLLETGLQGQVPMADQLSGRSALGYRKGLRLVGQNTILDRGGNFSLAWIDDCAYVTTTSPGQIFGPTSSPYIDPSFSPLNGLAVIDASDPTNPELLDILQSPAMIAPHESLHANEARRIIVGVRGGGTAFDVYDATDCRKPVLKSSINIGIGITLPPLPDLPGGLGTIDVGLPFWGHALCITDDGMTAYATSSAQTNAVIDLSDIEDPKLIQLYLPASHDCGLNPEGTRLYQANFGFISIGLGIPNGPAVGQNGLLILDVSGFQDRTTPPSPIMIGPTPPEVGFIGWTNILEGEAPTAGSHTARWFKQGDKTYVYSSDEWPTAGVCPWAHSRIIDITDETNPVKVSDIILEVNKPENCLQTELDIANYSAHYVGFDDKYNATTLFMTYYTGGLRVWDIRDPANPFEIAYWHPAPNPNTPAIPASEFFGSSGNRWDAVATYVRYRPETGHIWIAGYSSGFQILEFTETAGPTAPRPTGN